MSSLYVLLKNKIEKFYFSKYIYGFIPHVVFDKNLVCKMIKFDCFFKQNYITRIIVEKMTMEKFRKCRFLNGR